MDWINPYELDGAIHVYFFSLLKQIFILQLFWRMLEHCFAVKLQKCFVDYESTPDFPSA